MESLISEELEGVKALVSSTLSAAGGCLHLSRSHTFPSLCFSLSLSSLLLPQAGCQVTDLKGVEVIGGGARVPSVQKAIASSLGISQSDLCRT